MSSSKTGFHGSAGPGFPVDIIDDSGNPVSLNVEGDIAIKIKPERPVGLFREYLGNPEATAKTIRPVVYNRRPGI